MPILILEGSSTAGKSTLAQIVRVRLLERGVRVLVHGEDETFLPVLESAVPSEMGAAHLLGLVGALEEEPGTVHILDRFHLSAASMMGVQLADLTEVEERLASLGAKLYFLRVDERTLPARILGARNYRGKAWEDEVLLRGGEQAALEWFADVQRKLRGLYDQSALDKEILDATNSDFEGLATFVMGQLP